MSLFTFLYGGHHTIELTDMAAPHSLSTEQIIWTLLVLGYVFLLIIVIQTKTIGFYNWSKFQG